MRKSAAPSKKFKKPIEGASSAGLTNENILELKPRSLTDDNAKIRSTSQVLNLLKGNVVEHNKSDIIKEVRNTSIEGNSNKLFYNITWRKKTCKKHKTWQGDGMLEINGQCGVLKDSDGKVLGRVGNLKIELIEDGFILSVGDKDVQILDKITNIDEINVKRALEDVNREPVPKKQKLKSSTPLLLHLSSTVKKKQAKVVDSELLILPQPPPAHQWKFNVNKMTITEVCVDPYLARVLRQHQRIGVIFLYESILGFKQQNSFGAILADEMGLGKTLQCITLIWTLLKQGPYGGTPIIKKCLIVTPSSLTENWEKEFLGWLGRERIGIFLIDSKNKPKDYTKISHVPVAIISYEMFVRYFDDLCGITFDLLICDEGHRLKNNSVKAAVLLKQLKCKHRIILTGTPIQNDLQEFYSLSNFVNPGILGSSLEYRKYYEEPIIASREPDADEDTKNLGEERAKELSKRTKHFILRRTQSVLDKYLPTKTECVIFCKSSLLQQKLYVATLDYWENRDLLSREIVHLNVITALKKICNHPCLIRNMSDSSTVLKQKLSEILSNNSEISIEDSGKLKVLLGLVKTVLELKEKIVIVSSYTQTLDLLADICRTNRYKFTRLDGSVPSNQRYKIVSAFNDKFSQDSIFLLSSKAGGVGLNLFGASRLVLYDSDWNPATDLQAMARIWREGQKHSVFLYRFLTSGTIEEKIYQRQISKIDLSNAIVELNNKNSVKLSDDELKDLFSPEFECDSLTHSMLNCQCLGTGPILKNNENILQNFEERKSQLGLEEDVQISKENLKMNHLMQWEHYKHPIDVQILKTLGLNNAKNEITCIFRDKCDIVLS